MFRRIAIFPLLLFIFIFAIYLVGISRSVYGGDSGDIILAAFFGGVAHPPGYPLNSILGYFFTHLPIAVSVAYKANIAMALFMTGTVIFLFLILKILFKNVLISLSASLVLAFSPLFWLYAHITEVFQLNLLLVSVSVYFLFIWRRDELNKSKSRLKHSTYLMLGFFFLGLAVFHHQTAVLLIPAYLYLIFKTRKSVFGINKQSLQFLVAFILGSVPYVFVPFLALRYTPINWDNAASLGNFIKLVTRADYGTFAASSSFVGTSYQARLLQVLSYFAFVKNDFTPVGSFLILLGAFYTFVKERKIFWFLLLAVFFTGPFFLFYSSFSLSSDFLFGIWERFILLSYFFLTIFLAYGLCFLYLNFRNISRGKKKFPIRREVFLVVIQISFLLLPLYMLRNNWQRADMSNFELGDWLGHDVLASSVPGSLIFLFDDTTAFNTQYIYYTQREYSDRTIILSGILKHIYYREQVSREFSRLSFPADFLVEGNFQSDHYIDGLIKANFGKVPIYSVDSSFKIEGYTWVTIGLLKMLVKSPEAANVDFIKESNNLALKSFAINIDEINLSYGNFIPQSIKRFYGFSFNEIGDQMLALKSFDDARNYYKIALTIQPDNSRAFFGVGNTSLELGDCSNAKTFLLRAHDLDGQNTRVLSVLADEARRCEQNEGLAKQYEEEAKKIDRSHMEKL